MSTSQKLYLVKRPNKRYYIRILNDDGTTTWKSTGKLNKIEAVEFFKEYQKCLEEGPKVSFPTLKEFLVVFKELNKEELRARTIDDYEMYVNMYIELAGNKPINEYTSLELGKIRAKKIKDGWSISSANVFTRSIKAVFGFAVKQEILEDNPNTTTVIITYATSFPINLDFSLFTLDLFLLPFNLPILFFLPICFSN